MLQTNLLNAPLENNFIISSFRIKLQIGKAEVTSYFFKHFTSKRKFRDRGVHCHGKVRVLHLCRIDY